MGLRYAPLCLAIGRCYPVRSSFGVPRIALFVADQVVLNIGSSVSQLDETDESYSYQFPFCIPR
jgi:hypothetical protein